MTDNQNTFTLVDPLTGNLAFKLFLFEDNSYFDHLQRNNYFSVIWVKEGSGRLKSDFSEYSFEKDNLLAFTPYQPFMLSTAQAINGVAIQFHPDFFCIHKHHKEVSCSGILFDNIYHPPYIKIDATSAATFDMVINQVKAEMQNKGIAQFDILVSYLKIFLITASRLKSEQQVLDRDPDKINKEPFVLQSLQDAIEMHYKTKHSASDYADMLNISAKALARITKSHFNKTISNLIAERIIIEAKRELYLTNKPVKEIAWELGYEDEYYFSRFFKTNADVSPQMYRDTVGFGRASDNQLVN
ncbi:helix-turn-helix domain-containing protein [Mucilaginibacter sp. OK283]|jgi:AraC-like DNA-binding protein|uniref:helix-turn-helix domain-containing protein n=1 Tax=Mucilaginibacter sp. OK283 TaxID=1881049 RepID=UPI0008D1AB97|nr:helix-turn-helix domain-containing protein [Mucilaginibacter sp. OK283]SEP08553.1 AraC-type DNA-binding protein [Mucilaginibacter sp. OK283]